MLHLCGGRVASDRDLSISRGEDTAINIADLTHGTYVVENQADDGFSDQG